MGVHIREIYTGKWYLRITYKGIRMTKAVGSKDRAVELKKKLTTALELYGVYSRNKLLNGMPLFFMAALRTADIHSVQPKQADFAIGIYSNPAFSF